MKEFFDTLENIDSRELCDMINEYRRQEGNRTELQHKHLLAKIRKEIEIMEQLNVNRSDKYLSDLYIDKQGKQQPCYKMNKYSALQILNSESVFVRYKTIEYIEQLEKQNEKLKDFIIEKFGDSNISLTKVFGDTLSVKTINEWLISNGYCVRMRHPNGICDNAVPTTKIPADYFKIVERRYGPRDNKGPHTEWETRYNVKGMLFILDLLKKNKLIA